MRMPYLRLPAGSVACACMDTMAPLMCAINFPGLATRSAPSFWILGHERKRHSPFAALRSLLGGMLYRTGMGLRSVAEGVGPCPCPCPEAWEFTLSSRSKYCSS